MKLQDFKKTKEIKNSNENRFCECCLKENPESDRGYTLCCHEDVINKEMAVKYSKRMDVLRFIQKTNKEATGHGNLHFRNDAIIKISDYLFNINVNKTENEIINEVLSSFNQK